MVNEKMTSKPHPSFWLISIFMLLWNILGSINFFVQMDPEMVASYREVEKLLILGRPLWVTIGFAVAVFGGALGCLLLLLKKEAALYLFIASLLGVIDTVIYSLSLNITFSMGEIIGIVFMPIAVAGFLIWYTTYVKRKGWI